MRLSTILLILGCIMVAPYLIAIFALGLDIMLDAFDCIRHRNDEEIT